MTVQLCGQFDKLAMGGGPNGVEMDSNLITGIAGLHTRPCNTSLVQSYGLAIQTVSWEDTARSKNSCWGPNISDLTLSVLGGSRLLPMIRKPNFADVTADLPMRLFSVTTGNETPSGELKRVSFKDYVSNTLSLPGLILERDDVLLASAQACVLPCGSLGETEFCPQLFSYQARPNDPAVLVIVASSQGTSSFVITGARDTLYFNRGGQAAMYLAKRLSQDRAERGVPLEGKMTDEELDRNAILIFQIPLKQRTLPPPAITWTSSPFPAPFGYTPFGASPSNQYGYTPFVAYPSTQYGCTTFGAGPSTHFGSTTFGACAPTGAAPQSNFGYKPPGFAQGPPPTSAPSFGSTAKFGASAPPQSSLFGQVPPSAGFVPGGPPPTMGQAPGFSRASFCRENAPRAGLEYATLRASEKTYGALPSYSGPLQRDERFPIRVTFQMYTVTDDPVLKEAQVQDLAERISKVYAMGQAHGSLVTNSTDSERATEPRPLSSVKGAEDMPLFRVAA